jgi:epoxide hydrolase-like predicted phosphatase
MIKAVIFDYFGVICSDEYWDLVQTNANANDEYNNIAQQVNLGKLHWVEFINIIAQRVGKTAQQVKQLYETESINPQMLALVEELHKTYKTGLLTNANHEFIEPVIARAHLGELFDEIAISSREGVVKPDERFFQIILNRLGVKADEAIFIDDIEKNTLGAISLGMPIIIYDGLDKLKKELKQLLV